MASVSTDRRQGLNSGAAIKVPCRAATTGNITLSGLQTIDGVVLAAGDRVLVKNQTTGLQNGVYVADTGTWTRDLDFDGPFDIRSGTLITVNSGTVNAATCWRVSSVDPITIDATTLTIDPALFSSGASVSFTQTGAGAHGVRTVQGRMRKTTFSVEDFGAIGDGASHPLSGYFATLAAAQAEFPAALSLTDEIDWAAGQKALDILSPLATSQPFRTLTWEGPGTYITNRNYNVQGNVLRLVGNFCNIKATLAGQIIFDVANTAASGNGEDFGMEGFVLNCNSLAWHGIRVSRGARQEYRGNTIQNWTRSGQFFDGSVIKQQYGMLVDTCKYNGKDNVTGEGIRIEESGAGAVSNFTQFTLLNCGVNGGAYGIHALFQTYNGRVNTVGGVYQNQTIASLRGEALLLAVGPRLNSIGGHFENGTGAFDVSMDGDVKWQQMDATFGTMQATNGARMYNAGVLRQDTVNGNYRFEGPIDTMVGVVPQADTTAHLASIAATINTSNKWTGKMVFNTNTAKPVYATGAAAGSVWNDAVGALAHTPV